MGDGHLSSGLVYVKVCRFILYGSNNVTYTIVISNIMIVNASQRYLLAAMMMMMI